MMATISPSLLRVMMVGSLVVGGNPRRKWRTLTRSGILALVGLYIGLEDGLASMVGFTN